MKETYNKSNWRIKMKRFKRKSIITVIILVMLTSLIAGCSNSSEGEENNENQSENGNVDVIEIKLGHSSPAVNDRLEAACQEFKKIVEEKTDGKVVVTTYPASQLGAEREQLEAVQMGTLEMAALSTGPVPGFYPEIMVFDMPYLFSSADVAYEVLDGQVGQEILDGFREATGVRGLVWGENGFRHFTNDVRPIENPSDLEGLKIRTMENPAHMDIVRTLGGDPTPMSFSEVYTALSQGTIDGQENPISLIVSMKFYEAQQYLTLDGHVYNPYILMINDEFYQSLDEDVQEIIDEAAIVWRETEREQNQKQIDEGLLLLEEEGVEITELSVEKVREFREATNSVYEEFGYEEVGEELINKVLSAVEEAENN
jgi:C4-dicarboxylate-binding protein DctP